MKDKNNWIFLIPIALVVSVAVNISMFMVGDDQATASTPDSTLLLALNVGGDQAQALPQLGMYQMGAHGLNEAYKERLEEHYADHNDDEVDIELGVDTDNQYYGANLPTLHVKRHALDEQTDVEWVVGSVKDVGVMYISYQYIYSSQAFCEKAAQYIKDKVASEYNVDLLPRIDPTAPMVEFALNYNEAYQANINDTYQIVVGSDCDHDNIKDVIVRVGMKPEVLSDYIVINTDSIDRSLFAFRH